MSDPVLTVRLTRTEWIAVMAALLSATHAKPPLLMVRQDGQGEPSALMDVYPLLGEFVQDVIQQLTARP